MAFLRQAILILCAVCFSSSLLAQGLSEPIYKVDGKEVPYDIDAPNASLQLALAWVSVHTSYRLALKYDNKHGEKSCKILQTPTKFDTCVLEWKQATMCTYRPNPGYSIRAEDFPKGTRITESGQYMHISSPVESHTIDLRTADFTGVKAEPYPGLTDGWQISPWGLYGSDLMVARTLAVLKRAGELCRAEKAAP
jgi:hypothetical protein